MSSIKQCLEAGLLLPGDASKLAGKLAWACSHIFKRILRAMLRRVLVGVAFFDASQCCDRPIFDQKTRRDGRMSAELVQALGWWLNVGGCFDRCTWIFVAFL